MKRTYLLALALSLVMGGTAFGADIQVYQDGSRLDLQHPLWKNNGQMMLSVDDFVTLTGGEVKREDGEHIFLHIPEKKAEDVSVWLESSYDLSVAKQERGWVLQGQEKEGEWYLPLREAMTRADWKTTWSKTAAGESITLETPVMPRISMDAVYDKEKNSVSVTLYNEEPQRFMYGLEYFLQRWNGQAWEDMQRVRSMDINGIGFGLLGCNEKHTYSNAKTYGVGHYGDRLEQGTYRICLPIYTTIHRSGSAEETAILSGWDELEEAEKEMLQELYYRTEASQPAFTLPAGQEHIYYILSGEFTVK